MLKTMCSGKIHLATVQQTNLNYVGSITIDRDLMDTAGFVAYEQVHVLNMNNGARLITYVIEGERGSGTIYLNGAASRHAEPGDKVIIIAYSMIHENELNTFKPRIVFVDDNNQIKQLADIEKPATIID